LFIDGEGVADVDGLGAAAEVTAIEVVADPADDGVGFAAVMAEDTVEVAGFVVVVV
jgi:hypothetical protein